MFGSGHGTSLVFRGASIWNHRPSDSQPEATETWLWQPLFFYTRWLTTFSPLPTLPIWIFNRYILHFFYTHTYIDEILKQQANKCFNHVVTIENFFPCKIKCWILHKEDNFLCICFKTISFCSKAIINILYAKNNNFYSAINERYFKN